MECASDCIVRRVLARLLLILGPFVFVLDDKSGVVVVAAESLLEVADFALQGPKVVLHVVVAHQ